MSIPTEPDSSLSSVAIVGGGVAGLAAARELSDSGYQVHVFDKGRGAGGRASTRRDGDRQFDHGAQYFTARGDLFRSRVDDWIQEGLVVEWRGRIATLDRGELRYKEREPKRYVGVPAMNAVVKRMTRGLSVQFGVRIDTVERSEGAWQLIDTAGERLAGFDVLLLAVPPEQALVFLERADAPLADRVRPVTSHPCWSVMASFDARLPIEFDAAFVERSALAWVARNSSKPGRPDGESWVLHASPAWTRDHIDTVADQVAASLMSVFFKEAGVRAETPRSLSAHRWMLAKAAVPLEVGSLWDSDRRIGVCGDWCDGCRVEGAFTSGLAMAAQVVEADRREDPRRPTTG